MIERFAAERRQVNLAVSLHAATDELRDQLLPVNRRYPLAPLIEACGNYVRQTGRRVSFEWALIAGVNDGADQAQALVKLVKGLTCHVNLIPLNPTSGFTGTATSQVQANAFARILAEAGVTCTIRSRRGIEIDAGCGQLAVKGDVRCPGFESIRSWPLTNSARSRRLIIPRLPRSWYEALTAATSNPLPLSSIS